MWIAVTLIAVPAGATEKWRPGEQRYEGRLGVKYHRGWFGTRSRSTERTVVQPVHDGLLVADSRDEAPSHYASLDQTENGPNGLIRGTWFDHSVRNRTSSGTIMVERQPDGSIDLEISCKWWERGRGTAYQTKRGHLSPIDEPPPDPAAR
jgi:hypothetical protein